MSDAHEKAVNEVADIYPPPFNHPYGVIREYLERVSTEGPVIVVDGKVVGLGDGVAWLQPWAIQACETAGISPDAVLFLLDAAQGVADE